MIIKASLSGAKIARCRSRCTLTGGRATRPPQHVPRRLAHASSSCARRAGFHASLVLVVVGIAGYTVAMPGWTIGNMTFDAHAPFASLAVIRAAEHAVRAHREDPR